MLISFNTVPPGEYFYEQTEGIRKKFGHTPELNELAGRVAAFRKGNNLPRATSAEALQDIITYTCQRLGNNPRFCYDTEKPFDQLVSTGKSGSGCSSCGAPV